MTDIIMRLYMVGLTIALALWLGVGIVIARHHAHHDGGDDQ